MRRLRSERGAAAVEFALVLPILLIMILGIIEMGLLFNAQISVTHAAREAARTMAVQDSVSAARDAARTASPALNPALTDAQITVSPTDCTAGATATVTIQRQHTFVTTFFGSGVTMDGRAAMRCGG